MFFGGPHSPIQGPFSGPYGGTRPQDLTNLLYEVIASNCRAACDLSTPKAVHSLRSIPPPNSHIRTISFGYIFHLDGHRDCSATMHAGHDLVDPENMFTMAR